MRQWALRIVVFSLFLLGGLAYVRISKGPISYRRVRQPVPFSHYVHTHGKEQLQCWSCHRQVKTGYHASLPNLEVCSNCHLEAKGKSAQEKEFIRTYIDREKRIPWKRLFVLPDHVFFSHRLHVVKAKIECQSCHADMDQQRVPPPGPLQVVTMNDCLDCHRQRKAATDCNSCHR